MRICREARSKTVQRMRVPQMNDAITTLYRVVQPVINPKTMIAGLMTYPSYLRDFRRYRRMSNSERIELGDAYPRLHDRTLRTGIDAHYFYTNGWAMRRITLQNPAYHVDIGSQTSFVNLLSAVLRVTFVDYRPLDASMHGLDNCGGNIITLPFASDSLVSLSCLHVAEHIGLGRYGDPLNAQGTQQACSELQRVLAPGGDLYFVVPVGRQRVCFNAHRVHAPSTILAYFSKLDLVEFSGMRDDRTFVEHAEIDTFADSSYACGMFWFRKPLKPSGANS